MPDLAHRQVQRLIQLVAWMSQRDSEETVSYGAVAAELGHPEATVRKDLQVLLDLTESCKPWLASLSVVLDADGFSIGSRGPFRRPLRLSRDEALALFLGLVQVRDGASLARRLGVLLGGEAPPAEPARAWAIGREPAEQVARVLGLARQARDQRRKLELLYCGSAGERSRRVVHPYQVVEDAGTWYLVAWCEVAKAIRHFRVERVLEATLQEASFVRRRGARAVRARGGLLRGERTAMATVAFSTRIKRWLREQYPGGREAPDGRWVVSLPVADPRWLAREVLQYGADAEVLAPAGLREYLRQQVWQGQPLAPPAAG